jgi:hypothetical protein
MKKPAMIIDVLAGPGEDEEDEDDSFEGGDSPTKDPAALISSIEQQLSELRQYVKEMG